MVCLSLVNFLQPTNALMRLIKIQMDKTRKRNLKIEFDTISYIKLMGLLYNFPGAEPHFFGPNLTACYFWNRYQRFKRTSWAYIPGLLISYS